jgi:hypothetical protein
MLGAAEVMAAPAHNRGSYMSHSGKIAFYHISETTFCGTLTDRVENEKCVGGNNCSDPSSLLKFHKHCRCCCHFVFRTRLCVEHTVIMCERRKEGRMCVAVVVCVCSLQRIAWIMERAPSWRESQFLGAETFGFSVRIKKRRKGLQFAWLISEMKFHSICERREAIASMKI